jgi:YD repeat-containing protein
LYHSIHHHAIAGLPTYDNLDRLTKADYGGGVSVAYAYDNAGNITATATVGNLALFGDIDGSGSVDLADAIIGLQLLTGIEPTADMRIEADVNGDGKIGPEEVVYIMEKSAGKR